MYLENLVIDAVDPQQLGGFWEAALGSTRLTDDAELVETRLSVPGGPALDLCFPRVPEPLVDRPERLHLDLYGGDHQAQTTMRLLGLGARPVDIGQGDVPWNVLTDAEGNPFCVMEERIDYLDTGPIAALPLESADPSRDVDFWGWLTGWVEIPGVPPPWRALRHPSLRGPLLEICPEEMPKVAHKNRMHLDVRLEGGDEPEDVAAGILSRGGHERTPYRDELPWQVFTDPSGNELCVLAARAA